MTKELRIEAVIKLTEDEFGMANVPASAHEAVAAFKSALSEIDGASISIKPVTSKGTRGPRKSKKLAAVA